MLIFQRVGIYTENKLKLSSMMCGQNIQCFTITSGVI